MLQAITAGYFVAVLIGSSLVLGRTLARGLPPIGAALAYKPVATPLCRQAGIDGVRGRA